MKHAMRIRPLLLVLVLMTSILAPSSSPVRAAATLELYGTFQAMGVIVTLAATDDPDEDAAASVEYRTGSEAYHAGFPLSRVSGTRFVGSLFWLKPGTPYDVRVTFSDADGVLNGAIVSGTGSTRTEIVIPAPSHSYYVSPSGSGAACSLAVPCSLTEGLGQAQPGQEVVLRGGVYYRSETLPRSGTSSAPIVVKGYPGETAVLDGADPATFTWTNQGSGVWHTTVNASDPHLVLSNGQRLYPYQNLSDLQNLFWGIPGFYASGTTLYVRLAGDANPNTTTDRKSVV